MDWISRTNVICEFTDDYGDDSCRSRTTTLHQHSKKVYRTNQGDRCLDDDDGRNCPNILLDSAGTNCKLDVISQII